MSKFLHDKHFTLEEAQITLRGVIPLLEEITALKEKLDKRGFNVYRHEYFGGSGPNGERFFPVELETLVSIARKVEEMGILLKNFESGLIDFPHIRSNGQEVYLCWRLGEDEIEFWHGIPDGFAGRKPLDEL